ncbi:MAG: sigma-70 family RNA polymerase sigma factor [Verrucomicrobiota bacterium]|nr:sigma-70 family RNA polymerase sigma factor [Verrucomicrobiota bacterium]HCF93639.1 RNA polymerase subunit sigma [Verrucomicrobiota bacterium]
MSEYSGSLKRYMNEICQVALVTPEQEIELAKLIAAGDENARQRLIRANLRLVVKIAHDFKHLGLPLVDLISEGNIGLMKAVDRFDPSKGAKLSTYAAWWIRQYMMRALANQAKTIRLPAYFIQSLSRMNRTALQLTEKLGRQPTDAELAEAMELDEKTISRWRRASKSTASLNAPIEEGESKELQERVADESAKSPLQELLEKQLPGELAHYMDALDEREKFILAKRFDLDGEGKMTLEEVGEQLNVTRERVRQIQNEALVKLRKMLLAEEEAMAAQGQTQA